jgi:AcrR family transcriptional regulator
VPEPATDHRRAVAERNLEAILDAAERLLERHAQPSIAAVAAEAGVSRVTVYAHFATREALLEALVQRAVAAAPAALARRAAASLQEPGRHRAMAQAAAEHLDPATLRGAHEHGLAPVRRLLDRGRAAGEFRTDLTAEWQLTCFFTLLHAAGEDLRSGRASAQDALDALTRSLRDLIVAR